MVPPDPARPLGPSGLPIPVGPAVEEWRAMSPEAREAFLDEVNAALTVPAEAMVEGRPHKEAKLRTLDRLGLHFRTLGRPIYLAEELAVVYPGEPSFGPDVLAVVDVVQAERDERLAWVVADEGRGPDFVLEVLHQGDRKKDLVHNVQRYARLSIPEYFVYDRARQQVIGYRLAATARYERIVPQGGRTASAVLGIDFSVQDGVLCLFQGAAELYGTTDLLARLGGMVGSLEIKASEAELRTEHAEAEARAAEAEARAAEAEARAAEALANELGARARRATDHLRNAVIAVLASRGIAPTEAQRARVLGTDDEDVLGRWLARALGGEAATAAEVFAETAAKDSSR